jgi:hypothetical protein
MFCAYSRLTAPLPLRLTAYHPGGKVRLGMSAYFSHFREPFSIVVEIPDDFKCGHTSCDHMTEPKCTYRTARFSSMSMRV